MKTPKKPKKTNEEKALESRQRLALDEEIEESEERLKALARGKLGNVSLLSGAGRTSKQVATAKKTSKPSGSMLSGGSSAASSPKRFSLLRR